MIGHRSPISGIACWEDTWVATAGYDNQIILWDAASGTARARSNHDHLANQCTFSPDGRHLLSSSSDYSARIWSVPDLRLVAVLGEHDDDVEMAAFHPNRDLVATASRDHKVRVFRTTGENVQTFSGHSADVISVAWASDGDTLISSSDDGTIKRWSLAQGTMVDDLDMDGVETDTIALSPEGSIYAGNDAGEIVCIDRSGQLTRTRAHEAGVKRLVLGLEQSLLVSLSYDRTARLWDVTGESLHLVGETTMPDDVWPRSCAFSKDGQLVFGTFGRTYRTYDYVAQRWNDAAAAPTPGLNAVAAVAGGPVLAVGDAGVVQAELDAGSKAIVELGSLCNFLTPVAGVVFAGGQLGRLFDARSGVVIHQHRSPLNCGAHWRSDGVDHAIVGTYTGEGLLLDVEGDTARVVDTVPLLRNAVKGVAAGDQLLFAVGADCSAGWWDLRTLARVEIRPNAHDRIANGCAALGNDRFVSVSRDLLVRVWEGTELADTITTPHEHSIKCVAANADGKVVATGGYDGTVALLDVVTRRWLLTQRPTTSGISSITWCDAESAFLASSYDGMIYRVAPGLEA